MLRFTCIIGLTLAGSILVRTSNTTTAADDPPKPLRLFIEAEDFQPVEGDWSVKDFGTNYYAGTFAVTFLSRGRYLSAPERGAPSKAVKDIDIPRDGTFEVWARYEQPYDYSVEFDIDIQQDGKTVFQRGYGRHDAPKLWAFGKGFQPQVLWEWGGGDNIVWEGRDSKATLHKGKATMVLRTGPQKDAQAARRNVDVIVLTDDKAGIERQLKEARYLPLDGWLTQAGDVHMTATNPADSAAPLAVQMGPCTEHSPYWVHVRDWPKVLWLGKEIGDKEPKPEGFLKPGESSPAVEVGQFFDSLNQFQWKVQVKRGDGKPAAGSKVRLAFSVSGAGGKPEVIRDDTFAVDPDNNITFFLDSDIRRTKRIRTVVEDLELLHKTISGFPNKGKRPEQFLIDGIMGASDGTVNRPGRAGELCHEMALALGSNTLPDVKLPARNASIDVRGVATKDLPAYCQKLVKDGKADRIRVVSLGDEIHIGGTAKSPDDDAAFRDFLKQKRVTADALDLKSLDDAKLELKDQKSLLYYHSHLFSLEKALGEYKERTDILQNSLSKEISVGANYSPHPYYWPKEGQWVRAFARKALTLPWGEDYTWQVPEASLQINGYLLTAFRCGAKYDHLPIHWYVMPHYPGNTPDDLRRAWYTALGHGAKQLNFFCATPLSVAYTENYVTSEATSTWRTIHDLVYETGQMEHVVYPAKTRRADVAMLISFAQDLWETTPAYNHERKSLYLTMRQMGYAIDFITEEDIQNGRHKDKYGSIYIIGDHMERATARELRRWVFQDGGVIQGHAGGGFFDEHNRPMDILEDAYGVKNSKVEHRDEVIMSKQQLPRLQPLDQIQWDYMGNKMQIPALAYKQTFAINPRVQVWGRYADGSPAMIRNNYGRGVTILYGSFIASAYIRDGIPRRPYDRGTKASSFNHFLPTEFNGELNDVITAGCGAGNARWDVITDKPITVETVVMEGPSGLAVACINFTPVPQDLHLTVQYVPPEFNKVTSIQRGPIKAQRIKAIIDFKIRVDVADMILIEKDK
jgi:hypothetical protein